MRVHDTEEPNTAEDISAVVYVADHLVIRIWGDVDDDFDPDDIDYDDDPSFACIMRAVDELWRRGWLDVDQIMLDNPPGV